MMSAAAAYGFVVFAGVLVSVLTTSHRYQVVYKWTTVDYTFHSEEMRQLAIRNGSYIPENNIVTGIKVYADRIYLSVPRLRNGVPATLAHIGLTPVDGHHSPKLQPFPTWSAQAIGRCAALQSVQSMEIDTVGRMWVIDSGRINMSTEHPITMCPAKLIVYDLETGEEVRKHVFPDQVAGHRNHLNDIVVDCRKNENDTCFAYISDSSVGALVVYDYANNVSWKVQHRSMNFDPSSMAVTVNGKGTMFKSSINGIALSPLHNKTKSLYYTPLSSYRLYRIDDVRVLRDRNATVNGTLPDGNITDYGLKTSQSAGMVMTNMGTLYYGMLNANAIYQWNTSQEFTEPNQDIVAQNDTDLQWVDTFAIDERGYLWATTNRLPTFLNDNLDTEDNNIRLVKIHIDHRSYLYNSTLEPATNITVVNYMGEALTGKHMMYNSTSGHHNDQHRGNGSLADVLDASNATALESNSNSTSPSSADVLLCNVILLLMAVCCSAVLH